MTASGNWEEMSQTYSVLTHQHQSYCYKETSQLICRANQLTGFYMMATLAFNKFINTTMHNYLNTAAILMSNDVV